MICVVLPRMPPAVRLSYSYSLDAVWELITIMCSLFFTDFIFQNSVCNHFDSNGKETASLIETQERANHGHCKDGWNFTRSATPHEATIFELFRGLQLQFSGVFNMSLELHQVRFPPPTPSLLIFHLNLVQKGNPQ